MRPAPLLLALFLGATNSLAATWQLAAGPTRSDGSALEIAGATARWETALGYVSEQEVTVRTLQDTCLGGQRRTGVRDPGRDGRPPRGRLRLPERAAEVPFPGRRHPATRPGHRPGWSLEWRHFSNAGLDQPNLGQDLFLFRANFGSGE